jgi:microcystin degradation protein MlrC
VARIFIGGIATETSTFSPVPTGLADFQSCGVFHGDATAHAPSHFTAPLHVWRRRAEADGHEVVEGLMAFAEPGGTTTRAAWSVLKEQLLADVSAAGRCDAILLNLHGAMIADGQDDCEGDLLEALRRIAGPDVVIAVELDLHCHLAARMVEAADLLVTYKEYPHTDIVAGPGRRVEARSRPLRLPHAERLADGQSADDGLRRPDARPRGRRLCRRLGQLLPRVLAGRHSRDGVENARLCS